MGTVVKLSHVKKIAAMQCTQREAAAFLGIRLHIFQRLLRRNEKVAQVWEEGQQLGLISLRRTQFRHSRSSPQMAIHLGKVYLGQKEVVRQEHTGTDGGPIETFDVSNLSKAERNDLRRLLDRTSRKTTGS